MSRFTDAQAHAFRRLVRGAVATSGFTKSERDVVLALVNLWFHHKGGHEGVIYPGREKLAKKARVSVRTVATTLAMLREMGVIIPVAYAKGGRNSTRYKLRLASLLKACGSDLPEWMNGDLVKVETVQNSTVRKAKIARLPRAKIAHGKNSNTSNTALSKEVTGFEHATHAGGNA